MRQAAQRKVRLAKGVSAARPLQLGRLHGRYGRCTLWLTPGPNAARSSCSTGQATRRLYSSQPLPASDKTDSDDASPSRIASPSHPLPHDAAPAYSTAGSEAPAVARPDHRTIATAQELFTVSEFSPGSPLILPNGAHVMNKLMTFLRAQYQQYGFREVITPNIYKKLLWELSGHWQNYKDDMYTVYPGTAEAGQHGSATAHNDTHRHTPLDEEAYGLKPMNCPGHCLLMRSKKHTYKEMPVRYADFSALHRNEVSGSLSGLTRVRRFHQDDAHIFCRPHQIGDEIEAQLRFTDTVLGVFGLKDYRLVLSTRPEKDFIGSVEMWQDAEHQLTQALQRAGKTWTVNEGDGAFYGPKIDLQLKDSDSKYHQLSTIQLDMNLPERFGIRYVTVPGEPDYDGPDSHEGPCFKTPVLIHRAIFGSLERFFALLIEHYNTRWPFWLSFNQAVILTVNDGKKMNQAAHAAASQMSGFTSGPSNAALPLSIPTFRVDVNGESHTLSKKIVDAKKKHYSFICVLGPKNLVDGTIDINFSGHAATRGYAGLEKYLEGLEVISPDAETHKMKMKTKDVYDLFLRLERAFQ